MTKKHSHKRTFANHFVIISMRHRKMSIRVCCNRCAVFDCRSIGRHQYSMESHFRAGFSERTMHAYSKHFIALCITFLFFNIFFIIHSIHYNTISNVVSTYSICKWFFHRIFPLWFSADVCVRARRLWLPLSTSCYIFFITKFAYNWC